MGGQPPHNSSSARARDQAALLWRGRARVTTTVTATPVIARLMALLAMAATACSTESPGTADVTADAALTDTGKIGAVQDGATAEVAVQDSAPLDAATSSIDTDAAGIDGLADTQATLDGDGPAAEAADDLTSEGVQDAPGDVAPDAPASVDATSTVDANAAPTPDGGDADLTDAAAIADSADASATDAAATIDASPDLSETVDAPKQPWGKPVMPADLPSAAFVDVTADYGLDPAGNVAPCVAVADFDDNGRQDILIVKFNGPKAVIHTVLLGAGAPVHVDSAFDMTVIQPNFGCSTADMDGDAKPDLLIGGYSGSAVYLGNGKGGFVDATADWMPYITDFAAFSTQPADLDGDGDLDIFVGAGFDPPSCDALDCTFTESDLVCTVDPPPPKSAKLQDRVLIRQASLPLVDETPKWNVPGGGTQTVALALDVDDDGKLDVLVGDDFGSHRLLHNKGGTFTSYATDVGFHPYAGAMGWTVGEFDGDSLFDVVLAESGPLPVYVQKTPAGGKPFKFEDNGGELGSWWPLWGASEWAPLAADFDHDGQEDLQIGASVNFSPEKAANFKTVCGSSKLGADPFAGETSIDVLFLRKPTKGFTPLAMPAGKHPHVVMLEQRLIDLDADGDLDIVQSRPGPSMMASRTRVLRNDLVKAGQSMQVVVRGKGLNQDALGTTITAKIGGKTRTRWLNGGSWGATPTRFAHFGLGGDAKATDVVVKWPDGTKTAVGDVLAGQTKLVTWK